MAWDSARAPIVIPGASYITAAARKAAVRSSSSLLTTASSLRSRRTAVPLRCDQTPIDIVVVDRHGDELRLVGVGPHGVMRAWLQAAGSGWSGAWDYLGRSGTLGIPGEPGQRRTVGSDGSHPAGAHEEIMTRPGAAAFTLQNDGPAAIMLPTISVLTEDVQRIE